MIDFVATEEGRAVPTGGTYSYEYFLKDHLGNTRATVKQDGSVVQVQDYYAFGLEMNRATPTRQARITATNTTERRNRTVRLWRAVL